MILDQAKQHQFKLGLKLVRGAYYEMENERAKLMNYPSPVHTYKKDTDDDYNKALTMCIENITIARKCSFHT